MKKTILILIFLFIFLTSFSFAAQTTQVFNGQNGIEIKFPLIETHKINTNANFHFHMFNLSNGYAYKTGDNVNCTLHIYKPLHEHVYINSSNVFHDVYDIEFVVPSTVFNETGEYSYIILCSTPTEGGFSSSSLQITKTGTKDNKTIFIALSLLLFGFCAILLYIAFNLEPVHIFLKLLILFVVIFMQIFAGKFAIDLVSSTAYISTGLGFYSSILWFIRFFVGYLLLYFIYTVLDYLGKVPQGISKRNPKK